MPVEKTEFNDLISLLEMSGFINVLSSKGKDLKNKIISLVLQEKDIIDAMETSPLLSQVIMDGEKVLIKTKK